MGHFTCPPNMLWFSTILLLLLSLFLFRHILRLSRLLHKLEDSVCSQRRLIPDDSREILRKIGALGLVDSINELIDSNNQSIIQKNDYSEQIDVILGAVQEAVIVFNDDHVVEYANRSTERTFNQGLPIQGMSLEVVFRSSALLEHLDSAANQVESEPTRIKINQGMKKLWFEVSCSKVQGIHPGGTYSTLLVMHDITKQKDLEASRRKFVANASHELRTPLTIIKGFAEALTDDKALIDSKMRDRFTKKILKNAGRLHRLVEDLLTISRLESQPYLIEPVEQSIESLFTEVAESYYSRLDVSRQRIEVKVDEAVDPFSFDRYRINQVLDNLVENVFRYAPEFRLIRLEAVLEPGSGDVHCAVIDDGPGIPKKHLQHLFERFYRVDKGRSNISCSYTAALSRLRVKWGRARAYPLDCRSN
jgi:two-component system phosphate regulon sensor histidine kinase PhoR